MTSSCQSFMIWVLMSFGGFVLWVWGRVIPALGLLPQSLFWLLLSDQMFVTGALSQRTRLFFSFYTFYFILFLWLPSHPAGWCRRSGSLFEVSYEHKSSPLWKRATQTQSQSGIETLSWQEINKNLCGVDVVRPVRGAAAWPLTPHSAQSLSECHSA